MKKLIAPLLAVALLTITSVADDASAGKPAIATCHVCRYNRDLACVEFRLKPTTPQVVHAGGSYCFCSEECRTAFVKKPERYIPKPKGGSPQPRGKVPSARS